MPQATEPSGKHGMTEAEKAARREAREKVKAAKAALQAEGRRFLPFARANELQIRGLSVSGTRRRPPPGVAWETVGLEVTEVLTRGGRETHWE